MEKFEDQVFYSLSFEDIQTVAIEEIERKLSMEELSEVAELVSDLINWHEIISYAIMEKVDTKSMGL